MGSSRYFHPQHKELLKDAVVIAEEVTSDFFKLSHWRRARYDILTLEALRREEVSPHALALVAKYHGRHEGRLLSSASFDFYRVCLQDHNILRALKRRPGLRLFPLLLYVLTHELVHIVRFSQFQALFDAPEAERRREEEKVHRLTQEILAPLDSLDLQTAIRCYEATGQGDSQYAYL
jgi:hypothetical protein